MSFLYTNAKRALLAGEIDLDADDIRAIGVASNTTADTEEDVALISAFTTLDESDDTGYARHTFSTQTVTADNANDRGEFDAEDVPWNFNGDQTAGRQMAGVIIYKHVGADSSNIPIAFIDSGGFPFTQSGSVTIQWSAEGIIQLT